MLQKQKGNLIDKDNIQDQDQDQDQEDLFYNSYLINSEYDNNIIELPIIYLEDEINQSWCKIINNINFENEEKFNNYYDTDIFVQDKIL